MCLCPVGAGASVLPQQVGRLPGTRGGLEDLLTDGKPRYGSRAAGGGDLSRWQWFRSPRLGGGAVQPQPLGAVPKVQARHMCVGLGTQEPLLKDRPRQGRHSHPAPPPSCLASQPAVPRPFRPSGTGAWSKKRRSHSQLHVGCSRDLQKAKKPFFFLL